MDADRDRWDERWSTAGGGSVLAAAPDVLRDHPEQCALLPSSGPALDVACGLGAQALWMAERGLTVTALDVSGVAIERLVSAARREHLDDCELDARVWDTDDGLPDDMTDLALIVCQRYRSPELYDDFVSRLRVGGVLVLTVLSSVGLDGDAGPFHAGPGELESAFDRDDVDVSLHSESRGQASIVLRRTA